MSRCERKEHYEKFLPQFVYHSNALDGGEFKLKETELAINWGVASPDKSGEGYIASLGQKEAFRFMPL